MKAARKTDMVLIDNCNLSIPLCCSHGPQQGIIQQVCTTTKIEGLKAARITDTGQVMCPHSGTFMIIKTCTKTYIDGLLAARLNDKVICQTCGSQGRVLSPLATQTFTHD